MDDEFLLILIGAAIILAPPILGIIAFARTSKLRREVAELRRTIALLRGDSPLPAAAPVSAPPPPPRVQDDADAPLIPVARPLAEDVPQAPSPPLAAPATPFR